MCYPVRPNESRPNQSLVIRILWITLTSLFYSLIQVHAQAPAPTVSLTQVPDDGYLLKEGWRFQPGDNPDGASPQLDDSHWSSIDPTKDVRELPQLQQAGIGWLRLHIHTGPDLPPLMVKVFQSVASEIYLDGRLLYRFGRVSANPDSVQAYNPVAAFPLPFRPSSNHVLAMRVAGQPGFVYMIKALHWDEAAVQFWLLPAIVLPSLKPVDVQALYLDTFKLGVTFILFILHLSLFLAYPIKRANLFAAGMYLLLCLALWATAANDFAHSLGLRVLFHYGSFLSVWMPAMAI